MSARYELRPVGVFDLEAGALVTPMSGAAWDTYHAWLAAGGAPDPMPQAPAPSLEEVLANKLAEIEDLAARARKRVTGPVSGQEMSSWTLKRAEALGFNAEIGDASAPMLAEEAAARGISTAAIVQRVLANATAYAQAEAAIAGNAGRHRDNVRALATAFQVVSYDASGGWPIPP